MYLVSSWGLSLVSFGLYEQRVKLQDGTFVPESLQAAVQSSRTQLLIEDEKIVDSEDLGESRSKQRIQPYEEQAIEDPCCSFGRTCRVLLSENVPLLHGLKDEKEDLDSNCDRGQDGNCFVCLGNAAQP